MEAAIVEALKPDIKRVYYDLRSTYFEGEDKNDFVIFGYPRDKKRTKEQIVIGPVIADGIPIYHQVWPYNKVESITLESATSIHKDRFHVKNTIIIGDRAFGMNPSLKFLDKNRYITLIPSRNLFLYI